MLLLLTKNKVTSLFVSITIGWQDPYIGILFSHLNEWDAHISVSLESGRWCNLKRNKASYKVRRIVIQVLDICFICRNRGSRDTDCSCCFFLWQERKNGGSDEGTVCLFLYALWKWHLSQWAPVPFLKTYTNIVINVKGPKWDCRLVVSYLTVLFIASAWFSCTQELENQLVEDGQIPL